MAAKMSHKEMIALIARHEEAEAKGDIENLMKTVSPNPHYEVYPLGLQIKSRPAVIEMYNRVLPSLMSSIPDIKRLNHWYNDDGYAVEMEFTLTEEDGTRKKARSLIAFLFEDGLLKGERCFLGPRHGEIFRTAVRPDFINFPGVSVL